MTYRIMCIRSASSIFGPGCAYLKENGKELAWENRADAEAELARCRAYPMGKVTYIGGCDHSVGICICDLVRLQDEAEALIRQINSENEPDPDGRWMPPQFDRKPKP